MVDVFDRSESTLAARLVLLSLAEYAHDDGSNSWPAVPTLASKARCDDRTVQRALRWLEDACEIVSTGTTAKGVTIWHLTVVRPLAVPTGLDLERGDNLSPEVSSITVKEDRAAICHPNTAGQDVTPGRRFDTPGVAPARIAKWLKSVGHHYAHSPVDFAAEIRTRFGAIDSTTVEQLRALALDDDQGENAA